MIQLPETRAYPNSRPTNSNGLRVYSNLHRLRAWLEPHKMTSEVASQTSPLLSHPCRTRGSEIARTLALVTAWEEAHSP